jgi:dolichol-phosphate mannosyltransferase
VRLFCIIPAYRAAGTVVDVVRQALEFADEVVVVDDGCPERSGAAVNDAYRGNAAVHVLQRESNGGVGAAMKTGIEFCLDRDADVIVKLDADGQMDTSFIPVIRDLFEADPSLVCIKGNRFFDSSVVRLMPRRRLFGNAILSLLAKFASGYWNVIDPTNGYVAFNASLLSLLPWRSFADTYFFEISVLCELGLKRLPILELEMPTIYTSAPSSLSIPRILWDFPRRLLHLIVRRILLQYFIFDVNLGSVYLILGTLLLLAGGGWGIYQWTVSFITDVPRSTGTVMLAVLPFLMGFQLVLNALMYDVQFAQKTSHELLVNLYRRFPALPRERTSERSKKAATVARMPRPNVR